MAKANRTLLRWRMRLSEFEFYIVHYASIRHHAADTLKLLKSNGKDSTAQDNKISVLKIS